MQFLGVRAAPADVPNQYRRIQGTRMLHKIASTLAAAAIALVAAPAFAAPSLQRVDATNDSPQCCAGMQAACDVVAADAPNEDPHTKSYVGSGG